MGRGQAYVFLFWGIETQVIMLLIHPMVLQHTGDKTPLFSFHCGSF